MCLTSALCNNTAGESVDHAATSLARLTTRARKVRVDFPGAEPLTGYLTLGGNGGLLVHGRPGVDPQFTADTKFQISFTVPKPRFAAVSHLRSAYLSVFSLLGPHAHRYAESKALLPVRQQIMNPRDEIIPDHFAWKSRDCTVERNAIMMNREQQHWLVKVGDCIVLLPRGGDVSFFEDTEVLRAYGHGTINGPLWYPLKFGQHYCWSTTLKEDIDIREKFGVNNLFGQYGKTVDSNGIECSFVIADHQGRHVTLLALP